MRQLLKVRPRRARAGVALVVAGLVMTLSATEIARAQGQEQDLVRKVEQSFSRGDAQELLAQTGERIEIGVFGSSTLYSRAQATFVLENFFRDHPPLRFRTTRSGGSSENGFVAGRYWYGADDTYLDVYFRYKCRSTGCEVRELRIERPVR